MTAPEVLGARGLRHRPVHVWRDDRRSRWTATDASGWTVGWGATAADVVLQLPPSWPYLVYLNGRQPRVAP